MELFKKLLILILLFFVTFGFLLSVIKSTSAVTITPNGGTFCDEGKDKFCWTSIPYWECRSFGGPPCADPVPKPPSQE